MRNAAFRAGNLRGLGFHVGAGAGMSDLQAAQSRLNQSTSLLVWP
ncbi:hypothetical protein [Herbidospora mongoliensis]|nr:hypothetical protein [Herbidospora mongoliensis]